MRTKVTPRLLQAGYLELLEERARYLERAIVRIPMHRSKPLQTLVKGLIRDVLADYRRSLQPLGWLRSFEPPGTFDDHDRVATFLLYQLARFELLRGASRNRHSLLDRRDVSLRHRVRLLVGRVAPREATNLFDGQSRSAAPQVHDLGILTVLEHEYQSIVRRLDNIVEYTDDRSFGQAILDRSDPGQDLRAAGRGHRMVGWTSGSIGTKSLLVVCAGTNRKEYTREYVRDRLIELLNIFDPPRWGWLIVGVCAGTDESLPIGTILVSNGDVWDLKERNQRKYDVVNRFPATLLDRFALTPPENYEPIELFRKHPAPPDAFTNIALPTSVPVRSVRFACPDHVISWPDARHAMRAELEHGGMTSSEHFGIEMEAKAVDGLGPIGIVKSIADFADNRKASWPQGIINQIQLYTADLAADYAIHLAAQLPGSEPGTTAPSHEVKES